MDKIPLISPIMNTSHPFKVRDEEWVLATGWGEVTLEPAVSKVKYALDLHSSSVLNLSLVVYAIAKKRSDLTYDLLMNEEKDRVTLVVKTGVEGLTYYFKKKGSKNFELFKSELQLMVEKVAIYQKRIPFIGVFKPSKWTEYSLLDCIADFDYSFLGLAKTPLIFTCIVGRPGYTAIFKKSPKECTVYVHWNALDSLPKKTDEIVLEYCIFPHEEEELKIEIRERKPQNEVFASFAEVREAVKKGRKLVVYENQVVDVKEFEERHIGSAIPLRDNLSAEIGRYIYGSFDHKDKLHMHTRKALPLMSKYQVGTIKQPILDDLYVGIEEGKELRDYPFKISEPEGITDLHALIKLSNEKLKLKPLYNKVEFFGRYCGLTSLEKGITRNYACVFSAEEKIIQEHLKMVAKIDHNEEYETPFPSMDDIELHYVPFIVKGLKEHSTWIVQDAVPGSQFLIGGPYGPGLELAPNQKGPVVAITAGTGGMLLFDLVNYLMRMNAERIGKSAGKKYKIFEDEDFSDLSDPSFQFILFNAYASNAVPYSLILRTMEKWETSHGMTNFKQYWRIGDQKTARWDAAYFKDKIPPNATKIFLAGGKDFLASVFAAVTQCGFSRDKIVFL